MPNAIKSVELSYGPVSGSHSLDLYYHPQSGSATRPLIVFVHGGAWWSEDKSDHTILATKIAQKTDCVVAVVNYRLSLQPPLAPGTKQVNHPEHPNDVLAALTYLHELPRHEQANYDPKDMILMGHSCGAYILTSLFLQPPSSIEGLPLQPNSPSPDLVASVKGILLSEGIFDIGLLLSTFPSYIDFIGAAFSPSSLNNTSDPAYKYISTSTYAPRPNSSHIRWKLLQSPQDSLIDVGQANAMCAHLLSFTDKVEKDYETLKDDHDELLKTDPIVDLVEGFVKGVFREV